jgi:hypothetical protein
MAETLRETQNNKTMRMQLRNNICPSIRTNKSLDDKSNQTGQTSRDQKAMLFSKRISQIDVSVSLKEFEERNKTVLIDT